jgi:hypothetical protein
MSDCAEEVLNKHHRGPRCGFGPVADTEDVVFAVFQKTPQANGRLQASSFDQKQLKRNEQSVSRLRYTSRSKFHSHVVARLEAAQGQLIGVAKANVRELRDINPPHPDDVTLTVRGVCVLATVTSRDHDGHAALGFSEALERINDTTKKQTKKTQLRQEILADLADLFGNVLPIEALPWPSTVAVWWLGWKAWFTHAKAPQTVR